MSESNSIISARASRDLDSPLAILSPFPSHLLPFVHLLLSQILSHTARREPKAGFLCGLNPACRLSRVTSRSGASEHDFDRTQPWMVTCNLSRKTVQPDVLVVAGPTLHLC